ncbi:glycine-rich protein [Bacillus thuringiensis]|nr:glycine-rich protein [Bacillus thuringiensis]
MPVQWTFNATGSGQNGGTNNSIGDGSAKVTNGIYEWTVPRTGKYRIKAKGAQGGPGTNIDGGFGALIEGEFNLTAGQKMHILVGQKPLKNGGGGGTFVGNRTLKTILLVAGGGGGGSYHGAVGFHASTTTTPNNNTITTGTGYQGGAGADFNANRARGTQASDNGYPGENFLNSTGMGGNITGNWGHTGPGGFGGGGGGSWSPGSGGGYVGGTSPISGGSTTPAGSGGASFCAATILSATIPNETGDGYVVITDYSGPNAPANLKPAGEEAKPATVSTLLPTFSWSFSDPEVGNTQSAYRIRIQGVRSPLVFHTPKMTTTFTAYTVPEGVLSANESYFWQVATWDKYDMEGTWSSPQYFKTTNSPTVTPTSPLGTGGGSLAGLSLTPRLSWTYSDAEGHTQSTFQVIVKRAVDHREVHKVLIRSEKPYYDIPVGVLEAGVDYFWQVQVGEASGMVSEYSTPQYFRTNVAPHKLIPDHIPDTLRVTRRPVFEATINDDIENDAQSFVLQLATNSDFTQGILEFKSHFRVEGWEYFDGAAWQPFPYGTGTIPATNEGQKIRYTIGADPYYFSLVEGTKYYWRMAAVDGTTGTYSEWTDVQTLQNLLGTDGNCQDTSRWISYNSTLEVDTVNKLYGTGCIKLTATAAGALMYKDITNLVKKNTYYLMMLEAKNFDLGSIYINLQTIGGVSSVSGGAITDKVYKRSYLLVKPDDLVAATTVKLYAYTSGGLNGRYAYIDGVRIYEITKAEYDLIQSGTDPRYSGDMLAVMYPYVDNTQTIPRKTSIRCGTTLALKTKPIKTTAPVDRSVFSKFATLPITGGMQRVENSDPRIVYGGNWVNTNFTNNETSGGTTAYTTAAGATAELTFIGTGIRFGSWKSLNNGLVDVYLDDVFVATVNQYKEGATAYQQIVYENTKLPYGPHKIKIVSRAEKGGPEAKDSTTAFDFFEILDMRAPAVLTVQASNNANDATPTWEDVTAAFISGEPYFFSNKIKTAPDWGLSVKILVDAKERLGPIEIDGFGISYE